MLEVRKNKLRNRRKIRSKDAGVTIIIIIIIIMVNVVVIFKNIHQTRLGHRCVV